MSKQPGEAAKTTPAMRRRREAVQTARMLKSYTDELYQTTQQLIRDHHKKGYTLAPEERTFLFKRRAIFAGVMERLVRKASGMIEHYDLESLLHAELVLRLRDAELVLDTAKETVEAMADAFDARFSVFDIPYEWPKSPASSDREAK